MKGVEYHFKTVESASPNFCQELFLHESLIGKKLGPTLVVVQEIACWLFIKSKLLDLTCKAHVAITKPVLSPTELTASNNLSANIAIMLSILVGKLKKLKRPFTLDPINILSENRVFCTVYHVMIAYIRVY